MRFSHTLALVATMAATASAASVDLDNIEYSAPIPLAQYVTMGDTVGLASLHDPLKMAVNIDALTFASSPAQVNAKSLMVAAADFENRSFVKADIRVDGVQKYTMLLDGKEISAGPLTLLPATHRLELKYVAEPGAESPKISIDTDTPEKILLVTDHSRMITLPDVMYGTRINGVSLSPSGTYLLVSYYDVRSGGSSQYFQRLYDVKASKFIATLPSYATWLSRSDRYTITRNDYVNGRHIVAIDPATGQETILCANIPEGNFVISPTDDFLIYSLTREGPKEDPQIYRVIEPEDRQPGWRDRTYPAIYRFDNPVLLPLVASNHDVRPLDISPDGSTLLLMSTRRRMTKRPTTLFSLVTLDLNTLSADTIVDADGFISEARFMPDGCSIAVIASPESFGRVGCTLPSDVIPSAYDYQLYTVDLADLSVKPLTRDFDPSINSMVCNSADGRIYVTVTERDMYTLYAIDPKTGAITPIHLPDNVVRGAHCASSAPLLAAFAQSDSSADAAYLYNIKNGKLVEVDRPSAQRLSHVRIGRCIDYNVPLATGDTVYARYYLPDNFDPTKKYPLIVNYYGGCSPSTRSFESRYPMHVYSSLGYVTLVIEPSGCTGFGQEWSSRHVSTAGRGVAEDIIAITERFCADHDFINPQKIGCIGASYGGFMTQYLLTQTPMFAAAISHAGISDHTSYWGEGYWGYSYSEVSMGDDLPWTNPDLYVKQSPLYNAHKIHTPILFLHGDADTNVPVGESIQMFTALKLLGVDAALVEVSGQNHHINDDSKRKKWQNTIFAWFAKYLQDDPTWWESLYPTTNL